MRSIRANLFEYWVKKIEALGLPKGRVPLVVGSKNQRLYWLVFVSRHELALEFWDKIQDVSGQRELF